MRIYIKYQNTYTDIDKVNKIYKTNTVHLSVSLKHLTTTLLELRVERITIFQF